MFTTKLTDCRDNKECVNIESIVRTSVEDKGKLGKERESNFLSLRLDGRWSDSNIFTFLVGKSFSIEIPVNVNHLVDLKCQRKAFSNTPGLGLLISFLESESKM